MEPFVQFRFAFRRWARGLSLVMLGLGLTYCATMRGTVSGGRYTSPDGRVSVAVPSFSGTGRFQEHHDSSYFAVIMTDDVGTLYRVEGFHPPLPATMVGNSNRACTELALRNALAAIRSVCPSARIASSRFNTELLGGAMIATVKMPAGTVAMVQKNAGPWRRVDSQRVLVIFKCNGALITISHNGGNLPAVTDERRHCSSRLASPHQTSARFSMKSCKSIVSQPCSRSPGCDPGIQQAAMKPNKHNRQVHPLMAAALIVSCACGCATAGVDVLSNLRTSRTRKPLSQIDMKPSVVNLYPEPTAHRHEID